MFFECPPRALFNDLNLIFCLSFFYFINDSEKNCFIKKCFVYQEQEKWSNKHKVEWEDEEKKQEIWAEETGN